MLILGTFAGYIADPRNADTLKPDALPSLVKALLSHRLLLLIPGLPALLAGLMLLKGARGRRAWFALGLLGVAAVFAALLLCLVAVLAPLYQYQEL